MAPSRRSWIVNGHLHLPKLRAALDAPFTENVSTVSQNEDQKVA